ncbi:hypothetical protein LBMAG33_3500 [Candidatus Levyibacteriota bacterium]|nr:hypothetical protein [Candidatus Levybacteria bacterium]MSU26020.1 hypothetical protein [Candidatus Levybacteria bacterium]GDX62040.1 hypothetical protein LBMAG33_3500 [Candidatus Levybacteria bacterium]
MNKKTDTLDPKLKEIYDRVMNSHISKPNQPVSTPIKSPAPTPAASNQILHSTPEKTTQVFVANSSKDATKNTPSIDEKNKEKKSGISPVIFTICGIIFFAIYTIFWFKIFNISLPFIPK